MTTYEQWRAFLRHVEIGAHAEFCGFDDARLLNEPPPMFDDPRIQSRYEQGFKFGKEKLAQQEMPV